MTNFFRTGILGVIAAALLMVFSGPEAQAQQSGYRLAAGDVLRFEVLEDSTLNRTLLVAPDGRISVPLLGTVVAGGQTVDMIRAELTERLTPNFAAPPTVFVALESRPAPQLAPEARITPIAIFVLGEASNTGRLELLPGTTVLQLFAQMGGFTNFAAQRRIQLRRGDTTWNIDYREIEAGRSASGNFVLADGDIIIIPQRRLFE